MSDRLDLKKYIEANLLDGDEIQKGQMIASTELLEALQSYTDTRENKARIDELLYLTNHADPLVLDRVWIQNRIKALNHRKDD